VEGVVRIGMIAGIVVGGIVSGSGSSDWTCADRVRSRRARDEGVQSLIQVLVLGLVSGMGRDKGDGGVA